MRQIKLKNCPFCKSNPITREWAWAHILPASDAKEFVVECGNKKCLIKPSTFMFYPKAKSMQEAIKRWNKRG